MRNVFLTTLIIISISGYSQDIEKFFTPSEILFSNTAINEVYLSNEEKDIFLYANLARKQPKKFNAFYREFVKVRRTKWKELLSKNPYYTSLSSDLLKQKQLDPLYPDKALFELAKCWAIESGERGITGHNRIKCENVGRENCSYGYSKGLDIIMQLLIDEGVESLGHRTNILSNSKGLGTSIQPHTKYGSCAVMDFGGSNDRIKAIERERKSLFPEIMKKWTSEEMKNIDKSRKMSYLNDLEKDYYMYVNMIRLYPKKFKNLFWDKGPYFDTDFTEQANELHKQADYKKASSMLEALDVSTVLIPQKAIIEAGRCVAREMNSKNKFTLTGLNCSIGQVEASTFVPNDAYKYVIDLLLKGKTHELAYSNRILVMTEGENFNVSLTLLQNN